MCWLDQSVLKVTLIGSYINHVMGRFCLNYTRPDDEKKADNRVWGFSIFVFRY